MCAKKYKAFKYKDVTYCIKAKVKIPKKYYELTDTFDVGKEIGSFRYFDSKGKEYVSLVDCDDNIKYYFEKDEIYVIGKKLGHYEGKKKIPLNE